MKIIKVFLTAFTAIFILAVSFQGVATAAQVKKVNARKGHIYIDQGKDAGFIMGAGVCFYSFEGEQITCGVVRQTTNSRAMVRVLDRTAKKIKKGMEASLEPEPSPKPSESY